MKIYLKIREISFDVIRMKNFQANDYEYIVTCTGKPHIRIISHKNEDFD